MNNNYTKQLNLNYLRIFNEVYKLRSTQKAALQLGISQSAVSQTLSKLRDYTGDKLFYSAGATLQSTHKADLIGDGLDQQLKFWDEKLNEHAHIDPKTFTGELTIAISSVLLEALANELTSSLIFNLFPNAKLNITIWDEETPKDIQEGRVHLGLNFYPIDTPKYLRATPLTESRPVILSRVNHPIGLSELTIEEFQKYPRGGVLVQGLPDYGAVLTRNHPEIFRFSYRSASMSVLVNLIQHSDLLVISENLSSSMATNDITNHQPAWLQDYIPSPRHHAVYYSEKNHNTPLYDYCIKAIRSAIESKQMADTNE
ncbi:LysR family transcriptional regulator [Vibrio variabilis]|uniref:LysR family transcriptional regulator n=1 Tax=Vibrio variabilis TaxID=990271 RepID=UPI000DD5FAB0|nr:LysR family transcriptional regulator [Vibrio variabilis]